MLMYSAEAERRFALINMTRVAEGGSLGEATVEKIRQDGVVLSLRGRRFLLAASN